MLGMKHGSEDLTGVLNQFSGNVCKPSFENTRVCSSCKKKVYKFFRLDLCFKPNVWHFYCIADFAPQQHITSPPDQILRPSGHLLQSSYWKQNSP